MPQEKIPEPSLGDDLIWGMENIATEIGLPLRRIYYLHARGKLPFIKKIGHRTAFASRKKLRLFFARKSPKQEVASEAPKNSTVTNSVVGA
jgi:hypothetical protein